MTTARTIVASTIGFYVFVGAQALDALRANAANARRRSKNLPSMTMHGR